MSTQTQIDRIKTAKTAIAAEIVKKGVAVPDGLTIDGYAALIAEIMLEISGDTPTILNGILKGNGANVQVATPGSDYAAPAILRTAVLGVASWTGAEAPFTQTVTVEGVLADETKQAIHISPSAGYGTMYGSAGIECTAQGVNSLTFSCEAAPENDITVNIVIQEATA